MSFVDEYKSIDPDSIRKEKEEKAKAEADRKRETKLRFLSSNIQEFFMIGRKEGILKSETITGFFGFFNDYSSGRWDSDGDRFCFLPCIVDDLQPQKDDKYSFRFRTIPFTGDRPMNSFLKEMNDYQNKEYRSSVFVSDLTMVLKQLGFSYVDCRIVDATYYEAIHGVFLTKYKKHNVSVPFIKCLV